MSARTILRFFALLLCLTIESSCPFQHTLEMPIPHRLDKHAGMLVAEQVLPGAVLPINLFGGRVTYQGDVSQGSLLFQKLTLSNLQRGASTYW